MFIVVLYTFRTFHGQIGSPMAAAIPLAIPGVQDALVLLETAEEQIGKFFKENKHLGWKKSQPGGGLGVGVLRVATQRIGWLDQSLTYVNMD